MRKNEWSARKSEVRVSVNDAPSSRNGSGEDVSLLVSQAPVKLREGRRVSCGTVNRRELDTLVTSIALVKSNDLALDAVGESGSQLKLGAPLASTYSARLVALLHSWTCFASHMEVLMFYLILRTIGARLLASYGRRGSSKCVSVRLSSAMSNAPRGSWI
jgi:hypothetical protein